MRFNCIVLLAFICMKGGNGSTVATEEEERNLRSHRPGTTVEYTDSSLRPVKMIGATIMHRGWPTESICSEDLGLRFSKVYFDGEAPADSENILPLTMEDFPLNMETAYFLRQSQCISVVMNEDCASCDMYTEELIASCGGYPPHPSRNPSDPYWDLFRKVIKVQQQRRSGVATKEVMPLPKIWAGHNLDKVAENVHDELPGSIHAKLIEQLISEGFNVDRDIIPSHSHKEFLRREVMLAYITTWAVSMVGQYNFAAKYTVGRLRPEEMAFHIAQGKVTENDGVPSDIVKDIKAFKLQTQFDFTAYPEGSPTHPSWPAMHSAGSAASLWLPVILNLTDSQICETKLVDWAVSYGRTVAGVHYEDDNIAGLKLGQEVIARKLADHLAQVYGSNPDAVNAKIEQMRFDWSEFTDTECYQANFRLTN